MQTEHTIVEKVEEKQYLNGGLINETNSVSCFI